MEWFPPVYVMCHPQKEPERFKFLLRHLPERGIPEDKIRFVGGIWGSEITEELYSTLYKPFYKKFGSNKNLSFKSACLSKGELSLCITFFNIINSCVKGDSDIILVFESDVYLRPDFISRLKEVLEKAKTEYTDWDYISLGEGVGTRPPGTPLTYFSETTLHKPPHQWVFRCTDSMVLQKKFMEKLQQTFFPVSDSLDWELNLQMIAHKGVSVWADPPLVEPGTNRNRVLTTLPA
jgi:hypothetical protein